MNADWIDMVLEVFISPCCLWRNTLPSGLGSTQGFSCILTLINHLSWKNYWWEWCGVPSGDPGFLNSVSCKLYPKTLVLLLGAPSRFHLSGSCLPYQMLNPVPSSPSSRLPDPLGRSVNFSSPCFPLMSVLLLRQTESTWLRNEVLTFWERISTKKKKRGGA